MVQLICTDRGQHPQRDIVEMVDRSRWPLANSTARWHVRWRESWIYPRHGRTPWHPVWPLDSISGDLHLDRRLIEAEVLVFRCPACTRRPRWAREPLDELCDRASAEALPPLDLSWLE